MNFETESIEFKSGFTEEIYKDVIAFANTGGVAFIILLVQRNGGIA